MRHLLEYRALADAKGKHAYDVWEYMGDSGTIFAAGTTRVVAEILQGSVECDDSALAEALEDALRQKVSAKKKTTAKKKTAPKKATAKKKTAAKKKRSSR